MTQECSTPITPQEPEACCRICWSPAFAEPGMELLQPCACRGTQQHVHDCCLSAWRQQCLAVGDTHLSNHCAVCKHRYDASSTRQALGCKLYRVLAVIKKHAARITNPETSKLTAWDAPKTLAAVRAISGGAMGAQVANRIVQLILSVAPEIGFLAAVFPKLTQPFLYMGAIVAALGLLSEVLLAGAAGFAADVVYGLGNSLLGSQGCQALNAALSAVLGRADMLLKAMHLVR